MKSLCSLSMLFFLALSMELEGQVDPCSLAPDPGPCFAYIPAYYWDAEIGSCVEFIWGGCEGTVPFWSLNECLNAECGGDGPPIELCDSIQVDVVTVGDAALGYLEVLVTPDYQTSYWYGYAGFALFDNLGALLAAENLDTAPNAYGFDGNSDPQPRYLIYEPFVDLTDLETPFQLQLRLYEGWMSGDPVPRCNWTWTSFGENTNGIGAAPNMLENQPIGTYDALGRPAQHQPGQLLIERYPGGSARKVIVFSEQ